MAYRGSTELSSVANPARCIMAGMWGRRSSSVITSTKVLGQNVWLYNTTDGTSDIAVANYFLDAYYLGMKEGDLIMGSIDSGSSVAVFFGVIGAVTTLGATLASSGGFLSSTR